MSTALVIRPEPAVADPAFAASTRDDARAALDWVLATADPTDQARLLAALRAWLRDAEAELERRFEIAGDPSIVIYGRSHLIDALIRGLLDFALRRLYPVANPTAGERLTLVAVGGYGRGELAPHSDLDLLFLHPYKRTPHGEQMIEFLLYKLWDLGLKVGQATRSVSDCLRAARADLTVCTTLLEARHIWGDRATFEDFNEAFEREVVSNAGAVFVEAKLAERDARHQRTGDSRYLLEPNIKEGKGGLRDLQTLFWLGRFLYRIDDPADLVRAGVLTRATLRKFMKAREFLWTVRCHLHIATGRAEERLAFDLQPEIAHRMGYRDRRTSRAVERFMKRYYLVAKEVGALTRIFCAAIEEQHRRRPRIGLARLGIGRRRVQGLLIQGGRVSLEDPHLFEHEPVAMLRMVQLAQERDLDVHPDALAAVALNLRRVTPEVRNDPEANALFLAMLTSRKDPATTLRRLNESGLLGRFVPEFARVVAQMEHSLYHVYTVDEHTIQVIGILHQIEAGEMADTLPLATRLMRDIQSRTELFAAAFFHDLGKGRGGDHSVTGAKLVDQAGPRLGLTQEQVETVSWLVGHHLLLSQTAFKRDIDDPKTVADLVEVVQSPERLRLLLILTAADIRAVGPNVWNGWKGQLLRDIYHATEAALAGVDMGGRRHERVERAKQALREALSLEPESWSDEAINRHLERHDPRYWLSFDASAHKRHALVMAQAEAQKQPIALDFEVDRFRARTELLLFAADHPGLFMKVAGALALSGVSIVDARIFTTGDGRALDSFGIQAVESRSAVEGEQTFGRIRGLVERALAGEVDLEAELAGRRTLPPRTDVIEVKTRVLIHNNASRTHTVIEVNGRDRPGLLYALARALKDLGMVISSAHITTYGERAVDVFYVKDVFGLKITGANKLRQIQRHLGVALREPNGAPPPIADGAAAANTPSPGRRHP